MTLSYRMLYVAAALASTFLFTFFAKGQQSAPAATSPPALPNRQEGDYVIRDYHFRSGETLPEVRLHFTTVGTPIRDAGGKIRNGVLIMHGSTNDASQVLVPSFTGPLVGAGEPLDATKYFLIFPDILGAGKSSKPSDGLHAHFPKYGYEDLVDLEHRLITEHFGIERLHLVMGVSMGGMHTWMWAERYPEMMDGLVALTSFPTRVDGRNLLWRRIISNAIRTDPEWKGGDYTEQPRGFLNIMPMFDMMVSSTARLGERLRSVDDADAYIRTNVAGTLKGSDANDILYRFESSFDYNPEPDLSKITAPLLSILFADDQLNPIELGVIEREMPRVHNGRYVIVPAGPMSQGHRSQVIANLWQDHLATFLATLPAMPGGSGR
jgi:homoserine O-acetyltransferase/O-succinyltransferase